MSLLRTSEIREMSGDERNQKLKELRNDLMHEKGTSSMGGAPENPGMMRALRVNIARILTVRKEEEEK